MVGLDIVSRFLCNLARWICLVGHHIADPLAEARTHGLEWAVANLHRGMVAARVQAAGSRSLAVEVVIDSLRIRLVGCITISTGRFMEWAPQAHGYGFCWGGYPCGAPQLGGGGA